MIKLIASVLKRVVADSTFEEQYKLCDVAIKSASSSAIPKASGHLTTAKQHLKEARQKYNRGDQVGAKASISKCSDAIIESGYCGKYCFRLERLV